MSAIARTLWFDTTDGRSHVSQDELLGRPECLIVLGEAGMGKTTLLQSLAEEGKARFRRARDFTNDDPRAYHGETLPLLIDALDELPAKGEGDAVDAVLQQLRQAGCPRFILSCRVTDWRGATAREAIAGQSAAPPLELHLVPFNEAEATKFLAEAIGDNAKAREVVNHFRTRGLRDEFLGNPQTLELIARVADDLPDTKAQLFDRAVDVLWAEANDKKEATSLDRATTLEAAGAAFTAILLTGSSTIVRKGAASIAKGELALKEVEAFDSGRVERAMASRLFGAAGVDRFSYWHRRIGEFLAARWLAAKADTRRKRKRLLAMFHASEAVPTSLRGLHAWLALDPKLAAAVIAADPMGVIEYGDADLLTEEQARGMLSALGALAKANPRFRGWGPYRAKGLVQGALLPEVRSLITARGTDYGIRLLLLQQIEGTAAAEAFRDELLALARDETVYYGVRSAAVDCLARLKGVDWPTLVEEIRLQASHDSTRLAVEAIVEANYNGISDRQIVETIMAHTGLTLCPVVRKGERRTIGHFYRIERELPDDRLHGVIEELSRFADAFLPKHADIEDNELIDLAYALMLRRVELASIEPMTLWSWLSPFNEQPRYARDNRKTLADWLRTHDDVRQVIQRHVLLRKGSGKNIAQRLWRLGSRSSGLSMTEEDVVALLRALPHADRQDMRWREVLHQTPHDAERGGKAREAAKPFAGNNLELVAWIDGLPHHVPEYVKRQAERAEKLARKRLAQAEEARRAYHKHIDDVRAGDFAWVYHPARAYLNRYSDLERDLPPLERLSAWLGPDITAAALTGFEAFLSMKPAEPSAGKIARSASEGTHWNAQEIIVVALAERLRTHRGLADLSAERIMAGYYSIRGGDERHQSVTGLAAALKEELRRRDKWRGALILEFGTQFAKQKQYIVGLYELMRSEQDRAVVTDLAAAWLDQYPDMPESSELELVNHLTIAGRVDDLRRIAAERVTQSLNDERRRNWDAIQLLVDFDRAKARLGRTIEPDLLWHVRARAGDRRSDREKSDQSVAQMHWIVEAFRPLWPAASFPSGGSSGDTNPWDASDHIRSAINRLGDATTPEAVDALSALRGAAEDGYTDAIQIAQGEQRQKIADESFVPPTLDAIAAVLSEGSPRDAGDLQAVMLDALQEAQARLKGDPLDWYKGFFRELGGRHKDEEACRDELLKVLTAIAPVGVEMRPEAHGADEKRLDIECSAGRKLMIPIEIKGQWHTELWRAADNQLDALYAPDWRAERRGIYLILWFGPPTRLTRPPVGMPIPNTPAELEAAIGQCSKAACEGRVAVRVLDLTRP